MLALELTELVALETVTLEEAKNGNIFLLGFLCGYSGEVCWMQGGYDPARYEWFVTDITDGGACPVEEVPLFALTLPNTVVK